VFAPTVRYLCTRLPRVLSVWFVLSIAVVTARAENSFRVTPETVTLEGNFSRAQLLVSAGADVTEKSDDLTDKVRYATSKPEVVTVNQTGQLQAHGNGEAEVTVTWGDRSQKVPVKVSGVTAEPAIAFGEQVMPILSKAGCNAAACHASQYGKGGFKLSVFSSKPAEDHFNIVRDGLSRRVNRQRPEESLFLQKPTSAVPHGGGRRIERGSVDYQILAAWVAGGTPGMESSTAQVTGLKVLPAKRVGGVGLTQQLQVFATYSNGRSRDVTTWAKFDSTEEGVVEVSHQGLVKTVGRGQGAAMVRFMGVAQISQVVVPYADSVDLNGWADNNFIDRIAAAKFREIGISPSGLCDDAAFLRRAYLDVLGTLPTVEQAKAFLDSKHSEKRKKLIDQLLGLTGDPAKDIYGNEYAAYWALKWSDLLRSSSTTLGEQGMWAMTNWLTTSFRENKRYDKFARELLTARGTTYNNGPSNFYVVFPNNEARGEATAQLFLGLRVQCARCHHHPFETISQNDFNGLAAIFSQVGSKASANYGRLGGPRVIMVRDEAGPLPKIERILGLPVSEEANQGKLDRREVLADWLTSADNRAFSRNAVNRYVGYLLGRGLVESIDDMRATNPPSNVELMNALADDFVKNGYDIKQLVRTIMNSRLYQLDSRPTKTNATDSRFYSHYTVKRLPAEPLLDAIDAVTGVPTKFEKVPLGTRAIELPDAQYSNYLLKTFGKPKREAVCECERVSDVNLAQALHTLNSDVIVEKIANSKGRVAKLLADKKAGPDIVEELYLATLCRRPTAAEQAACRDGVAEASDAKSYYEDLLWSLINSKQFLFIR
jgi:hypothetical protein